MLVVLYLVVSIKYIRRFCDYINVLHFLVQTRIVLKLGWRSTTGPPDLWSSPVPGSPPDATAKSMVSSHHVALLFEV